MSSLPLIVTSWVRWGLWSKWILLAPPMRFNVSFLKADILCVKFTAESPAFRAISVIQISEQWFSAGDDFGPQRLFDNIWRHSWLSQLQERECYWCVMTGGQGWAAKIPTMHITAQCSSQMSLMSVVLRLIWEPELGGWWWEGVRDIKMWRSVYVNLTSSGCCHSRRKHYTHFTVC